MKVRRSVFISALSLTAVLAALSLTAVLAAQTAAPEGTASSSHHSGQSPGAGAVPRDSLRALASRVGLRIGTAVNTDALPPMRHTGRSPPTSSRQSLLRMS